MNTPKAQQSGENKSALLVPEPSPDNLAGLIGNCRYTYLQIGDTASGSMYKPLAGVCALHLSSPVPGPCKQRTVQKEPLNKLTPKKAESLLFEAVDLMPCGAPSTALPRT